MICEFWPKKKKKRKMNLTSLQVVNGTYALEDRNFHIMYSEIVSYHDIPLLFLFLCSLIGTRLSKYFSVPACVYTADQPRCKPQMTRFFGFNGSSCITSDRRTMHVDNEPTHTRLDFASLWCMLVFPRVDIILRLPKEFRDGKSTSSIFCENNLASLKFGFSPIQLPLYAN